MSARKLSIGQSRRPAEFSVGDMVEAYLDGSLVYCYPAVVRGCHRHEDSADKCFALDYLLCGGDDAERRLEREHVTAASLRGRFEVGKGERVEVFLSAAAKQQRDGDCPPGDGYLAGSVVQLPAGQTYTVSLDCGWLLAGVQPFALRRPGKFALGSRVRLVASADDGQRRFGVIVGCQSASAAAPESFQVTLDTGDLLTVAADALSLAATQQHPVYHTGAYVRVRVSLADDDAANTNDEQPHIVYVFGTISSYDADYNDFVVFVCQTGDILLQVQESDLERTDALDSFEATYSAGSSRFTQAFPSTFTSSPSSSFSSFPTLFDSTQSSNQSNHSSQSNQSSQSSQSSQSNQSSQSTQQLPMTLLSSGYDELNVSDSTRGRSASWGAAPTEQATSGARSRPTVDSPRFYWDRVGCTASVSLSLVDLQVDDPTGKLQVFFVCWLGREPTQLVFSRTESPRLAATAWESWRHTFQLDVLHMDVVHVELWLHAPWEEHCRHVASAALPPLADFPPRGAHTLSLHEPAASTATSSCQLSIAIDADAAPPPVRLVELEPRARHIIGTAADWAAFDRLGSESPTERVVPVKELDSRLLLRLLLSSKEPELAQSLRCYLFEKRADDGFCFLLDAKRFVRAAPDARPALALDLLKSYIEDSSPRQVAISGHLRSDIIRSIQMKHITEDLFEQAATAVEQDTISDANFWSWKMQSPPLYCSQSSLAAAHSMDLSDNLLRVSLGPNHLLLLTDEGPAKPAVGLTVRLDGANTLEVRGGPVEELVLALYDQPSAKIGAQEFMSQFLLTCSQFCTAEQFLFLTRLYYTQADSIFFYTRWTAALFRHRVHAVLGGWIRDDRCPQTLSAAALRLAAAFFVECLPQETARRLLTALNKRVPQSERALLLASGLCATPEFLSPEREAAGDLGVSLANVSARTLAEQLTLLNWRDVKHVPFEELLGLGWTVRNAAERMEIAPNVMRCIKRFNKVSFWIASMIVTRAQLSRRVELLDYFLATAEHLLQLRNFEGLLIVVAALRLAPVARLQRTWRALPRDKRALFEEQLEPLVSQQANFAALRAAVRTAAPPLIPALSRFTGDIFKVYEGNSHYLSREPLAIVNFAKMRLLAGILKTFTRCTQEPYVALREEPAVQTYLRKIGRLSEEQLAQRSHLLERDDEEQTGRGVTFSGWVKKLRAAINK